MDNLIAVGVLFTLCLAALAHGAVEAWAVAVLQLLIAILTLLWGTKIVVDKTLLLRVPRSFWPLLGLFILVCLQAVNWGTVSQPRSLSQDLEATRSGATILFTLLVFYLLQANFMVNRERVRVMAGFLAIFGFALAVFALLQHFTWNGKFYWLRKPLSDLSAPFGPFANHNHYAGYIELLIGLPIALIVSGGVRKEERTFYGFVSAIMAVSVLFSLSRGGIVSLLAELLFIVILSGQLLRKEKSSSLQQLPLWGRVSTLGVILLAVGIGTWWIGADPVMNRLGGETQDTLATSRLWIWRDSWQVFLAYPLTGAGWGAFQTVYPHHSQYDGAQGYVAQAHNDYLQILADGGIIGALLTLWFIWAVLRDVLQGIRATDPLIAGLALGSGAGFFALLVHSMIDFNLQLPANAMLFLLLCAIASFCRQYVVAQKLVVESPTRSSQHPPHLSAGVLR